MWCAALLLPCLVSPQPGPSQPGFSQPDFSQPDFSQPGASQPGIEDSTERELVRATQHAIARVSVHFENAAGEGVNIRRPGSGFFVSEDLLVTCAHLVAEVPDGPPKEGAEFWLQVYPASAFAVDAEVVARDERRDLALLRILGERRLTKSLPVVDPASLPTGSRVLAASRGGSLTLDLFAGSLAKATGPVTLREGTLDASEWILSDARFHVSLDGAPLLDAQGRVIGIHNSAHISPRPPGFDLEEGEEPDPRDSTDYSMIVSGKAILDAFADHLPEAAPTPLKKAVPSVAVGPVAAIEASVVSVIAGEEAPPETSAIGDPQSLRVEETHGSGVIVDASGLVLTSSSFFKGEEKDARVRLADGTVLEAEMLQRRRGAALLRLNVPEGVTLQAADVSRADEPIQGEWIFVAGRPAGEHVTVSVGVLSSNERDGRVQVASWVHPGHFGGAVVDREGRLLGLATDIPASATGVSHDSYLGFAIPLSRLRGEFDDWTPAPAEQNAPDAGMVAEVVTKTHGGLVNVLVSRALPQEDTGFNPFAEETETFVLLGQGSGVVIDPSGLILSNWHVVDAALGEDGGQSDEFLVEVTTQDDRKLVAKVLSTSRDDDLALLSVEVPADQGLHVIELGHSDTMELGDTVIAIGNPHGLANSVSTGIVSALNQRVMIQGRLRHYDGMLQTDAAINPGNSGGALLDTSGRLIGINSAGRTGAGLAIPIDRARQVFRDKLLSAENLRSAYLGFEARERNGKLFVTAVDETGPARDTLELEDQLVSIQARDVDSEVAFAQALLGISAWEGISLEVEREGERKTLALTPISYSAWRLFRQSGVTVRPVDYQAEGDRIRRASIALHQAYTGIDEGTPGVMMTGALEVTQVVPHGDEQPLALKPGDLLLGMTERILEQNFERQELRRFESVADLVGIVEPRAIREGYTLRCWIQRGNEISEEEIHLRKVR